MQTQSLTTSPTAEPVSPRRTRDVDEGFGALLIGAQVASVQLNSVAVTDATGLNPDDAGHMPDARRARIDRETDAARHAEAQQSRPGAQRDVGHSRAESLRQAQDDSRSTEVARSAPDMSSAAATSRDPVAKEPTLSPATNETSRAQTSDAAAPVPRPQDTTSDGRNAPTPEKMSTSNSQIVTVTTAGAARASTGADKSSDGTAAQALGRMLAGRADTTRTPLPATVSPPTTRGGATSETVTKGNASAPRRSAQHHTAATRSQDAPQRSEFLKLIQSMRMNRGQRMSSATLRIEPPELGRMKVDVRMTDDTLHLRVEVASERARQVLSGRVDELAAGLREHDIKVERFEVVTTDDRNAPERSDEHTPPDARDASTGTESARTANHPVAADADGLEDETVEPVGTSGATQDKLALLDVRA